MRFHRETEAGPAPRLRRLTLPEKVDRSAEQRSAGQISAEQTREAKLARSVVMVEISWESSLPANGAAAFSGTVRPSFNNMFQQQSRPDY
jgi:hypothetical protein